MNARSFENWSASTDYAQAHLRGTAGKALEALVQRDAERRAVRLIVEREAREIEREARAAGESTGSLDT